MEIEDVSGPVHSDPDVSSAGSVNTEEGCELGEWGESGEDPCTDAPRVVPPAPGARCALDASEGVESDPVTSLFKVWPADEAKEFFAEDAAICFLSKQAVPGLPFTGDQTPQDFFRHYRSLMPNDATLKTLLAEGRNFAAVANLGCIAKGEEAVTLFEVFAFGEV